MSNLHLINDWVEFNGKSSKDFGLTMNLDGFNWNHPQKQIDYVSVPGKTRDVAYIENKYNSVNQTFNFVLERDQEDTIKRTSDIVAWVSEIDDYKKLRTNLDPDYFFWALPANVGSFSFHLPRIGNFSVEFKLQPYAYMNNSDNYIDATNGVFLINNEAFDALPRFHLIGDGDCQININDINFNLTGVSGDIYIDSADHLAWDSTGKNAIGCLQFNKYPYLPKKSRIRISGTGGISKLEVMPFWRRIF